MLNRLRRRVWNGADSRLHRICQHDDSAFLRRRTLTVIAEVGNVNRLAVRHLQRLVIEEHDGRIAVVLHDNRLDFARQMILLRQQKSVMRMRRHDGGGHIRIGSVVRVFAHLIFLEIQRTLKLADVMEIRARTCQERIRADFFRRRLRQIRDDNRMMIRARSLKQQPSQQRLIRVRQFEQFAWCRQIERRFKHRLESHRNQTAEDTASGRPDRVIHRIEQIAGGHQSDRQNDNHVQHCRNHAGDHHAYALRLVLEETHHDHAGHDAAHHQVHHFG